MKKLIIPIAAIAILIACKPKTESTTETPTTSTEVTPPASNPSVNDWMSWENGIDIAGVTDPNLKMPNVIFHVAHMVSTPLGNAPSGMILYQPDSTKPPMVMGFISTDSKIGAYFGPKIFAGTPFEKAPVLPATFDIKTTANGATVKVVTAGHTFEAEISDLGAPYLINRAPAAMPPFYQQGVERTIGKAILKVDGKEIQITIPPVGISGGPGAVFSPNGIYAR